MYTCLEIGTQDLSFEKNLPYIILTYLKKTIWLTEAISINKKKYFGILNRNVLSAFHFKIKFANMEINNKYI